ncbi:RNA polymerase sigma-70 factor [Streptantibioticus cattleyicolor]|uniref:ECF-sigma factor n=1 Tax=Streptantibioticus cattleyicolor (strain ATCC 35852 / DSM 46488 / JCM 4925 / NBRC 14057 / NRRL 8057) TaxID=1003195 RepID=F8JJT3_STREN|nr:RNA polymerase sigma-70 factor [Streptantibioticus cattleyicolor]AEW98640.1 ECF-sigma factor [Streptantibioticus cattleyicolor NRRL 8057 = DSM 46488]CCB72300.1 RNA polymerase ECF-type sigma factor [Streptantibioticus cattleyicolor NRRL 8057 = DSM 46488]
MTALELFQEHRPMLFGIAYRMLGSAADAEDVVQDAWLRWHGVDADSVAEPRAYLARTVTNLSINKLRSAAARREAYVGPWLPEPLVEAAGAADADGGVERAEDVSLAMLVVLETLSPLERAVFVLREVFGFSHREIAEATDRSEAAVRQVATRARDHVRARRPRYDAPAALRRRLTDDFLAACAGGDLNQVLALLAPDVTAWSDGGGKVRAALRPVHGADKVARWILGVMATSIPDFGAHRVDVNGRPGLLITSGGVPDTVCCAEFAEDGTVTALHLVRNPHKLRRAQPPL